METQPNDTYFYFAVIGGSYIDFKNVDLSPWGIQGGLVESEETEKHIRSISISGKADFNWNHVKDVSQGIDGGAGMHRDWEYMNLLWPKDLNNPPSKNDYFDAIEAIRIVHPSEIYVHNLLGTQYFQGRGISFSSWFTYSTYHWFKYEKPEDHYFIYSEQDLQQTNEFLAFYKENFNKRDYIKNAIRYYSESFRVNTSEMSFICLCICLETIVPGKEQLAYRFRRNLSVLCSDSIDRGKRIYQNAKLLYNFRSKLVHSGMSRKDFNKFDQIFEYAQILASRMIIEMMLHDLPKIEDLDNKITELGYGQKRDLSENYNEFKGNILTWYKVSGYTFEDNHGL